MRSLVLCMATTMLLTACDMATTRDETDAGGRLESWRAKLLLGGGDNEGIERSEGRVVGGQMVEAGAGTLFPGRARLCGCLIWAAGKAAARCH